MNRQTQTPLRMQAESIASLSVGVALLICTIGCVPRPENEVVVYSALDQEFAAPILGAFQRQSEDGITVSPRFDIESTKTIGLVNRILAERENPSCDLFWNNEILHTVRLQKEGLLRPFDWQTDPSWPSGYKASDGTWCGFAARVRVLLINREVLTDPEQWPTSVLDLADPSWKGRCGIARPLFGTTATHAAVLNDRLGQADADALFRQIAANAVVLSGNKQVAQSVSAGQIAWGLTDTDDAIIERDLGFPVEIVFPDQSPEQMGALRIPNTLAILKDAPHSVAAERLAAYLMSAGSEERLAMGDSAQIPLFRAVTVQPRVMPDEPVRWMNADFESAADDWESLANRLNEIFPQ